MKIGLLGDLHFTDKGPSSRDTEDFLAHQLTLLRAVLDSMYGEGVRIVLQPGDVLDSRRVSNAVLLGLSDLLKSYKGFKMYCTLGQHDVLGHNTAKYRQDSDLAILEKLAPLTVLQNGDSARISGSISVTGFGFGEPETLRFLEGGLEPANSGELNIAIVHAQVGAEAMFAQRAISDFDFHGSWDLALFGDVHQGFPQYVHPSGTVSINVGVLTPMAKGESWVEGPYAILDLDEGTISTGKLLDVEPGDWRSAELDTVAVERSESFREALRAVRERSYRSDEDIVDEVASVGGFDARVVSTLKGYIDEHKDKRNRS